MSNNGKTRRRSAKLWLTAEQAEAVNSWWETSDDRANHVKYNRGNDAYANDLGGQLAFFVDEALKKKELSASAEAATQNPENVEAVLAAAGASSLAVERAHTAKRRAEQAARRRGTHNPDSTETQTPS